MKTGAVRLNHAGRIFGLVRQCEHGQLTAQRGIVAECGIATHGAQTVIRVGQTSRQTDTGPTTDTGQDADILLATLLIRHHVADDARGRFELVQFFTCFCMNSLQIPFERSIEDNVTRCRQCTRPDRELLGQ